MKKQRGFTLLEVMIALAIMGMALVMLMRSTASSIKASQDAHMMGVVTDLARGKMYDIEEKLLKDGFTDTDQSEEGLDFSEENWPDIKYDYKVQPVELPSFDTLQQMAKGQAQAAGSAAAKAAANAGSAGAFGSGKGSGLGSADADAALGGFQNSALGGMLSMFGGGGGIGGAGGDTADAAGASLISSQYQMFQDILKVSIRKVTLTMRWKVLGNDRDMSIVQYFTDQSAMDKVLKGCGSTELPDDGGAGSGSGKGKGSGSGSGSGVKK